MTVTAADVVEEVGAGSGETARCERYLLIVTALLDRHLLDSGVLPTVPVPAAVYDEAVLRSAAEMFNQSEAPNGVINQQFEDGGAAPIRIGVDPLRPAYPLVKRWLDGLNGPLIA